MKINLRFSTWLPNCAVRRCPRPNSYSPACSVSNTHSAALARVSQGPRTIDLDLLIVKEERVNTEFLTLPHPRLHLRRFVLVPLNELVPNLVHPALNKSVTSLLSLTTREITAACLAR